MKKTLFYIILLFGIFACTNSKHKTYTDQESNISFSYPETWTTTKPKNFGMNMLQVVSPLEKEDDFQEMVNIVMGENNNLGLNEFFTRSLKVVEAAFDELEQTEEPNYETINGIEYKKVRYNYMLEGLSLTAQLYVTLEGETSYIINCSALQTTFDEFDADFKVVINSLEIK